MDRSALARWWRASDPIECSATFFLRLLKFGAALDHSQNIDRQFFRLAVEFQLEPVFEKRLQQRLHGLQPFLGSRFVRRFRVDVVVGGIDPVRTARDLKIADLIRHSN